MSSTAVGSSIVDGAPAAAATDGSALDAFPAIHVVLLTQNIGTIECNEETLSSELQQIATLWAQSVSKFLLAEEAKKGSPVDICVIHLQEIGGKKFSRPLNQYLSRVLPTCFPRKGWTSGLVMPDEDDCTFTAMGTILFVSQRLLPLTSVLSYRHRTYVALADDPISYVKSKRALFMGAKFSNADTSRKGYLLTSLRVGSQILNFLNIHLFHDADNTVAVKAYPSEYTVKRAHALEEAIEAITAIVHPSDPLFVFGDFNTRLDGARVYKALQQKFGTFALEKKAVKAPAAVWDYFSSPASWDELHKLDADLQFVVDHVASKQSFQLAEMKRSYPPTYLIEAHEQATANEAASASASPPIVKFAHERFPAWCDRVVYNAPALAIMDAAAYFTAALQPMDHLPVYLRFQTSRILPAPTATAVV